MSPAELSDLQLDQLLGQVAPPPSPAASLSDRIVARSLRTPQMRAGLFGISRRHGSRRRPIVLSAVIAANVMAAAAAASSWDGQQFDFHRLTDFPRRVAAAIHIGHRHRDSHELLVRQQSRPPLRAAPVTRAIEPTVATTAQAPIAPHATSIAIPPRASHASLLAGRIERPHVVHSLSAPKRFHRLAPNNATKPVRLQIARVRPVEPIIPVVGATHDRIAAPSEVQPNDSRSVRSEQARAAEPTIDETATAHRNASNDSPPSPAAEGADKAQGKVDGGRGRRWQSPFFKRPHPRERGNRFRGRF